MRENETEAGKVRWVLPDGPDDVGGPVGRRWGRPDKDGDGRTKMGTNPDTQGGWSLPGHVTVGPWAGIL